MSYRLPTNLQMNRHGIMKLEKINHKHLKIHQIQYPILIVIFAIGNL